MCRERLVFLLLVAGLPCLGSSTNTVTVLLDFESDYSDESISEMKREMNRLLEPSGVELEFRLRKDVTSSESFHDLVLVKFKGRCVMEPVPFWMEEGGTLAFTHAMNGEVLPFSEVECEKVRKTVDSAMWGSRRKKAASLFGRALGRVMAHELYHVLGHTRAHTRRGVAHTQLSGSQLISDDLAFDDAAQDAVRSRR